MHSWIFQCPTFRTLLVALYRHDANTPAQDRTQLGVIELVKGAVVVDRRVDYLHGLSFEAVGDLLERVSHGGSCCGGRGAAMDIGGWLRRLGLEQYEAAFCENKIDDQVLPNLTAEDLKDLGVGMVGHRRMLLDAIAALRAETSAPTPLPEAPLATDKAAKDAAERRQVTVMFSDLVGSSLRLTAEKCLLRFHTMCDL